MLTLLATALIVEVGRKTCGVLSMDNSVSKFLAFFLQSAKTHILFMKSSTPRLLHDTSLKGVVVDLHRSAHSLKGECLAMGYATTGELAHMLELVFYEVKQGTRIVSDALLTEVSACIEKLESSLHSIESEGHEENLTEYIKNFQAVTGVAVPKQNL